MDISLTKKQLVYLCKEKGIPGVSKLNRFELIALLSIDSDPSEQPMEEPLEEPMEEPLPEETATLQDVFVFNPCKRLVMINLVCCIIYSLYYIRF